MLSRYKLRKKSSLKKNSLHGHFSKRGKLIPVCKIRLIMFLLFSYLKKINFVLSDHKEKLI